MLLSVVTWAHLGSITVSAETPDIPQHLGQFIVLLVNVIFLRAIYGWGGAGGGP